MNDISTDDNLSFRERGMVQPVWKKDINGKWKIAEFSWIFSNYSNLKEWTMTSEPSIGNHLRNDFSTNLFI